MASWPLGTEVPIHLGHGCPSGKHFAGSKVARASGRLGPQVDEAPSSLGRTGGRGHRSLQGLGPRSRRRLRPQSVWSDDRTCGWMPLEAGGPWAQGAPPTNRPSRLGNKGPRSTSGQDAEASGRPCPPCSPFIMTMTRPSRRCVQRPWRMGNSLGYGPQVAGTPSPLHGQGLRGSRGTQVTRDQCTEV